MSCALRIALVEPHEPDARWFTLAADDAAIAAHVVRYETGLKALARWRAYGEVFDIVIVSEVLPMLSTEEFVSGTRTLMPGAELYVACEPQSVSPRVPHIAYIEKPLSPEMLSKMVLRLRSRTAA